MHAQPFLVQISTVVCAVACVVARANTERPLPDRTVMCVPGKIIFTDDFDPDTFSDRWGFKEDFALRDGALLRTEIHPSESKRVFLKDARLLWDIRNTKVDQFVCWRTIDPLLVHINFPGVGF